ncbi:MAG: hypothetical protein JWQ07_5408 [Ramlibacter sp.]|nr:hypothetical protein [Ramlibacter sp.]
MVPYDSGIGGQRPYYSYARVLCPQWGPRPYLCWVSGGNAMAFSLIRLQDGRCGRDLRNLPMVARRGRPGPRGSGLDWLPAAGTENYDREPFDVESRRSPLVRVFKRLVTTDRQLHCGMAAENIVRGRAHLNDNAYGTSGAEYIARTAAHLAPRCDGLPCPPGATSLAPPSAPTAASSGANGSSTRSARASRFISAPVAAT